MTRRPQPLASGQQSSMSVTMSLPEAAQMLGVGESLARQLARRGQFPGAFKLSGRVLVHRQVFLEEIERLGRGEQLAQDDPDRILARAMGDARARLAALPRRSGEAG